MFHIYLLHITPAFFSLPADRKHEAAVTVKLNDASPPSPASLCCSLNLSRLSLSKCGSIVFHVNSQGERRERGVKNRRHDLAVLQCATSNCGRATEREGRSRSPHESRSGRIDYGRDGGMYSKREGGGGGVGHLALHLREKSLGSAN